MPSEGTHGVAAPLRDASAAGRAWPRISIVTPSFNQGRYIEKTIRSVIEQDYPDIEYILIDGASTDETMSVIKRYQRHLAFWVSEPDRGQSHAINKGMARATGDIRAYLNSDDVYLPGALRAVAEAYRDNPAADLFYGRCALIDAEGVGLGIEREGDISTYAEILDLWGVWWRRRNFVQPEVFWTKRVADRIGPFREDLHYAMDFEYWCRVFATSAVSHRLRRPVAAFRLWAQQKSRQADKAAAELLGVVAEHLWRMSGPLDDRTRRRLQADHLYQTTFLPAVAASIAAGEPALSRYAGLLMVLARHPRLLLARGLRARASHVAATRFAAFDRLIRGGAR